MNSLEMSSSISDKRKVTPLLISAVLVAPFIVLEWVNGGFHQGFPFVLFAFMAAHALSIVLLLTPAYRRARAARTLGALHLGHWAALVLAALLVYAYVSVVMDQLPCFLGVPNCD